MVHLKAHADTGAVHNMPHQHAFVLVGDDTRFAVHMTQFHCELHKYQLIFEIDMGDRDDELADLRQQYPDAALFLCNDDNTDFWFSIPSLASGQTTEIVGNIFVGLRRPPPVMGDHFFPWSTDRAIPAIANVRVKITRVVMFRPYAHHEELPEFATYFMWGKGDEMHMTNKQIAHMPTGPFEAQAFGPDVDMVMSLAGCPDWLQDDAIQEAGLYVTCPDYLNFDPITGDNIVPCTPRFADGEGFTVLYRGVPPGRNVVAGPTFMNCTAVINSPSQIPCSVDDMWGIFEMPRRYWGGAP